MEGSHPYRHRQSLMRKGFLSALGFTSIAIEADQPGSELFVQHPAEVSV